MEFYKIGGCVRDKILSRNCSDIDWEVIGATIEDMKTLGFLQVGKDFPVFLHPKTREEYSIGRIDISTGNGHQDYKFITNKNITLEEAVQRRDFTMNAIAEKEDGTYVDVVGGMEDIKNKIIRHINKDNFITDPLRVLRGCRFAAQLDFTIESETMELFKKMVADGMLEFLTPERVWKETEKALTQGYNSPKYFELLNECGALKVLMPEIYKLTTTPERLEYHPSGNTFKHTMIVLKNLENKNSVVKFMGLCHDFGKGATPEDILPSHNGHDERGLSLINEFCDRLKVPNKYREGALMLCKHHMRLGKFEEMNIKKHYDIVREISYKFKNIELLKNVLYGFYADWTGEEDRTAWNDPAECINIMNHIMNVFYTMENVNMKSLPENIMFSISKFKGEKFSQLYRDAMINYLRQNLKNDTYSF